MYLFFSHPGSACAEVWEVQYDVFQSFVSNVKLNDLVWSDCLYAVSAGAHGCGRLTPVEAWAVTLALFEETLVANGCGMLQCGWRTDEVEFFGAPSNSTAFSYEVGRRVALCVEAWGHSSTDCIEAGSRASSFEHLCLVPRHHMPCRRRRFAGLSSARSFSLGT